MFRSNKNVFKPSVYDRGRRRGRGLPRWVVTLITGILIGAVGFWFIQTNYGPPQLSVSESRKLNQNLEQLTHDKHDLSARNSELEEKLKAYEHNDDTAASKLDDSRRQMDVLKQQIALLKAAMPADPSGMPVSLQAAQFNGAMGELEFTILASTKDESAQPVQANVEMVVKGRYRNGKTGYSTLQPVSASIGQFSQIQGKQTLEQNTLTPRSVTITVRDAGSQKIIGQRSFALTGQ